VAEAAAYAPERINAVLAEAHPDATWRAALGLPQPSPRLRETMESLGRVVRAAAAPPRTPVFDAMRTALSKDHPDEGRLDGLVRQSLLATLENEEQGNPAKRTWPAKSESRQPEWSTRHGRQADRP
jgi:hypothetical protein